MTNFTIDIVSDTVCPWCYVGAKRLQKAISKWQATHPSDTFTTTWHPFYLNPDAHKGPPGIDKQEYYKQRFGPERTRMIWERLATIGRNDGIAFKFGGRTGNTRDSHRLIQLGLTKGRDVQARVVEELFKAYFENEGDITDPSVLKAAGVKAGLDEGEVKSWLDSDKGGKEVDEEVEEAQSRYISGVPNFTVAGRYQLEGAQDPEAFLQVFEAVVASKGGAGRSSTGDVC
jgi:predicted DsbA family dithiol-disulfide isomerase